MKPKKKSNSEEAYIGEIILFAGTRDIENWLPCDGRLLDVKDYQALYSILDTTYGGDGKKTFAIPDLRGAVPIGNGAARGRSAYAVGATGGAEQTSKSFTVPLPEHTHEVKFVPGTVTPVNPVMIAVDDNSAAGVTVATLNPLDPVTRVGNMLSRSFVALGNGAVKSFAPPSATNRYLGGVSGGGGGGIVDGKVDIRAAGIKDSSVTVALDLRQPYVALQYLICVRGTYPPMAKVKPGKKAATKKQPAVTKKAAVKKKAKKR